MEWKVNVESKDCISFEKKILSCMLCSTAEDWCNYQISNLLETTKLKQTKQPYKIRRIRHRYLDKQNKTNFETYNTLTSKVKWK